MNLVVVWMETLTFRHANLLRHLDDLDLDVDLRELLRQRVDFDETWVDGAGKSSELGDQTDVALLDGLVGVRAAETAGNCTEGTDRCAEGVDHAAVPAGVGGIFGVGLDDLGVGGLKILAAWRLDVDDGVAGAADGWRVAIGSPLD